MAPLLLWSKLNLKRRVGVVDVLPRGAVGLSPEANVNRSRIRRDAGYRFAQYGIGKLPSAIQALESSPNLLLDSVELSDALYRFFRDQRFVAARVARNFVRAVQNAHGNVGAANVSCRPTASGGIEYWLRSKRM